MSELEKTTELLRSRRSQDIPPEAVRFTLAYTRFLAEGKPVPAQRLADATGDPVEFIMSAFTQMRQGGAEFNDQGELTAAALSLSPTQHRFIVDGRTMYAWCALDTLFLPAYIGKSAQVKSTCPITGKAIDLTISPDAVEAFTPDQAVLSIMTAPGCSAGVEGTFCSQVNFFASQAAAKQWIGERPDFAILSVTEAYQLARTIYIEPIINALKD